jgi:predicted homoserine dehydrogenase-like protein
MEPKIADLDVNRVCKLAERLGWPEERTEAKSLTDALRCGGTFLTEDADVLIARDGVDVIVEATGNPAPGIQHALARFGHKRHIVMVNVEADVLAGPMLARRAAEADVLYSMAYGDQPALIAEMVDGARPTRRSRNSNPVLPVATLQARRHYGVRDLPRPAHLRG